MEKMWITLCVEDAPGSAGKQRQKMFTSGVDKLGVRVAAPLFFNGLAWLF